MKKAALGSIALIAMISLALSAGATSPLAAQAPPATSVFFSGSTLSAAEVGPHGLRYTDRYTITIDPPLEDSNSVHLRIKSSSTATQGDDYTMAAPNEDPATATKSLKLPGGVGAVSTRIWFRPDLMAEGDETVDFELVAIDNAPYVIAADNGVDRFPETQLVVRDNSRPIPAGADSRRGIHIHPKSVSLKRDSTVTYGISLRTEPSADVTVKAYFDTRDNAVDLGAQSTGMSVSPASLTFTSSNWSTRQFFTVSPGGSIAGRYLILHGLESNDKNYNTGDWFQGPGISGRTHTRVVVTAGGI